MNLRSDSRSCRPRVALTRDDESCPSRRILMEGELVHGCQVPQSSCGWTSQYFNVSWFIIPCPCSDQYLVCYGTRHNVNNAEGIFWREEMWNKDTKEYFTAIKSEALAYRFTRDSSDYDSTQKRIDLLMTYHGRPSGIFSGDEHLAGLHPSRGCEFMLSTWFARSHRLLDRKLVQS